MRLMNTRLSVLLFSCFFLISKSSFAQCSNPYRTYPVSFNFEGNNGGWTAGSTNSTSDWVWGHPSKPVINGAGDGQKCWVTGGLTGTGYNGNQRSWIQSPECFDFSNVPYPYIELKVFWETENKYDGAGFQYSVDGGTWEDAGAAGDNSNCMNKNWFNINSVTNLPAKQDGWSGNVQSTAGSCLGGGGSGRWVTARHTLYNLAGKSNVRFRFIFGSGTTCNNFDGFAIDDVVFSNTPPGPVISSVNVTNVLCFGTATGSIVALADFGIKPYTFTWKEGSNTYSGPNLQNLATGSYRLTVTDDNFCVATKDVVITQPPSLAHTVSINDATCGLSNGTASVTESGGAAPYTYSWAPAVATGSSATGLPSGSYVVTVKDNNNCIDVINIDILNKGGITANIVSTSNITCFGGNNGSATVSANGTGPFTYLWSPSGGTAATANNLTAGNYSVLVKDATGCTTTSAVAVTQPSEISAVITKQDATCNNSNGKAAAVASGGTGPFTYLWQPGNVTAGNIATLAPGPYTVTVTDATGCFKTEQVTINAVPVPVITITHTDVLCKGQANGTAAANVAGGTAPYNYKWTNGANTFSGNPVQNLAAGNYTLTVTDASGCTATASVIISQPLQLSHTVSTVPVSCTNPRGSAAITEAGGTAPYTYSWSPLGGNNATASGLPIGDYVVLISDSRQCTDTVHVHITSTNPVSAAIGNVTNVTCGRGSNGAVTVNASGSGPFNYSWSPSGGNAATANNLAAGVYTVTVTNPQGCFTFETAEVKQPLPIAIKITSVSTSCGKNNGSATATVSGGTGSYKYDWSPGNYSSAGITNLAAGEYSLTVTDANSCTATGKVTIQSLPVLQTTVTAVNTTCGNSNGNASVVATGGTAPYTYLWTSANNTTAAISNLSAGHYIVNVTDANACQKIDSAIIKPSGKPVISAIKATDATCNGQATGSATATVAGGTPSYGYTWANGTQNQTTETLQNAPAGTYLLTVTDAAGCTASGNTTVSEPAALQLFVTATATKCGLANGSAAVLVSGGVQPYQYSWSSGSNTGQAQNLAQGTYRLTVTDANVCTASANQVRVASSSPLRITLGSDTTICPGGEVILNPGTFASYTWHNNTHTPVYRAVQTGAYAVTVTDSIGCTGSASVKVNVQCRDLVFPTAFTPNGDNRNDYFGPLGTLSAVTNYTFRIYNRWGQPVFTSNNPYQKWEGKFKTNDSGTGTFVWIAEYSFNGQPKRTQKGTILLVK